MSDFLIVGAGINGLLVARELASAGATITIVDKGEPGKEASWAGGGIVSPLYPWRYADAVTQLANWAQNFYPELAAQLCSETGIDPQLVGSGLLMLDAEDEAQALAWAGRNQCSMEQVYSDFLYQREPGLAPGFKSGLWMPNVSNVRNPVLLEALVTSLQRNPDVRLSANQQVLLEATDNTVRARLKNSAGSAYTVAADTIVICSGAWSSELIAPLGLSLPVKPVKGQMLLYKTAAALIRTIVLKAGRYLIPRLDGHLLVGSTLEDCGFDKTPSVAARESLQHSANAMLPVLKNCQPKAQWAGLRPGSPDGIPFIGKFQKYTNLYINAGQYRNGLVLAPASARLLADMLLKQQPIISPLAYDPDRLLVA